MSTTDIILLFIFTAVLSAAIDINLIKRKLK